MSTRTKYITVLSVWMLVLTIGFTIPVIIESLNYTYNSYEYTTTNQIITNNSYILSSKYVKDTQKISIITIGYENETYPFYAATVIFTIMSTEQFSSWYEKGALEPSVLNVTYYLKHSNIRVSNLNVEDDGLYYFVVFNQNDYAISIYFNIKIIAYGHLLATAILGFLLSASASIFIIKIIATSHYIEKEEKMAKKMQLQSRIENNTNQIVIQKAQKKESFCPSCGASIKPKDGHYCSNCGSTI